MGKVRRCDDRCHTAKGTRCRCWCGGQLHGTAGAANRQSLQEAIDQRFFLEQHGFKEGETVYIERGRLPLEVASG